MANAHTATPHCDVTHTLSTTCPCEPATAVDGHRNADDTPPDFEAMVGDPIDADGYLIEVQG